MLKRSIALCKMLCPWDKIHGACFCLIYSDVIFYVCIWGTIIILVIICKKVKNGVSFHSFDEHIVAQASYSLCFVYILLFIHIAVKIELKQERD